MVPKIIYGNYFEDNRGLLKYNNEFDTSKIKRLYSIKNINTEFIRGWQGHKIEKRWFMPTIGAFEIYTIRVDNWTNPSKEKEVSIFSLNSESMNVLFIPNGYLTAIKSLDEEAQLLIMSDYSLNEINDEYRFPINYFKEIKK